MTSTLARSAGLPRAARRGGAAVVGWIVAVSAVLGVLIGFVWSLLAQRPQVELVEGELLFVDLYTKDYVQADMVLAILLVTAGAIVAVVAVRRWPTAQMAVLLGCVGGGFVASVLAWRLGVGLGGGIATDGLVSSAAHEEGDVFELPLALSAKAVVFLWPIVAAALLSITFAVRNHRTRQELISLAPVDPEAVDPEAVDPDPVDPLRVSPQRSVQSEPQ